MIERRISNKIITLRASLLKNFPFFWRYLMIFAAVVLFNPETFLNDSENKSVFASKLNDH